MARTIDLSGDVGEGAGNDASFIPLLTSASVACGGHAGDERSILEAIETAITAGVQVGAHPGFADREHCGRRALVVSVDEVYEIVAKQLEDFREIASRASASVKHVKPHGALYHQAVADAEIAEAVVRASLTLGRPAVVGPGQSALEEAAAQAGLRFIREAFADRAYDSRGRLVPRTDSGALIADEKRVIAQTLQILEQATVTAIDGTRVPIEAETICLHGDGANAVEIARRLREALGEAGIMVRPIC